MKPVIDMHQCLQDSPKFRIALNENENSIDILEMKLEKLVKLSNVMIESGKSFAKSKGAFVNGIWEMSVYFNEDAEIANALNRIIQTITELNKFNQMLMDQTQRAVSRCLGNFVKNDINKLKDTKRHFDKISDELDNSLVRNSQAVKSKSPECEEVRNLLTATRSCFRHTALDYICQIGCLQSKKRHIVLDSLLSLMQAYGTYFHQGSDLFSEQKPFIKESANFVEKLRKDDKSLQRQLQGNHSLVTSEDNVSKPFRDNIRMEGYLFKRTSNAFKTWNRRWFIIKDNQLVYQKRDQFEITVMEEDLRLCNVKPLNDTDRRYCFEIFSPTKNHVLQADTEESCKQWITALEAGIDAAYNFRDSDNIESVSLNSSESSESTTNNFSTNTKNNQCEPSPNKPPRFHTQILRVPGNDRCCDCGSPDPKWASINFGNVLCIECSGIHRGLGVHISKVRSLTLDDWDPEVMKIMLALGNKIVNSIMEEEVDEEVAKRPNHGSSRSERELWIRAKYVSRSFVKSDANKKSQNDEDSGSEDISSSMERESQGLLLYSAATNSDTVGIFESLARGADVNWSNVHDEGKTALHIAASTHCTMTSEFLLMNGAKCNQLDSQGRTCLHIAAESSITRQVCLLLKRGADQDTLDVQGRDALSIAVNNANADIVTILRLAKLNEEMRKDEYGNAQDEIFNEVVRDFSNQPSLAEKYASEKG